MREAGAPGNLAVIDTDVWSHLYGRRKTSDPRVERWRAALIGRRIVIATQTRAEVLVGLRLGNLGRQRSEAITRALDDMPTVPVTPDVVEAFVALTVAARRTGNGIGQKEHTADRWIASTAVAIGAPLLTADRVYRDAPGVRLLAEPIGGANV